MKRKTVTKEAFSEDTRLNFAKTEGNGLQHKKKKNGKKKNTKGKKAVRSKAKGGVWQKVVRG